MTSRVKSEAAEADVKPLPEPLPEPAISRDHEPLLQHFKAWIRRELALIHEHGMHDQAERETHNP